MSALRWLWCRLWCRLWHRADITGFGCAKAPPYCVICEAYR